MRLAWATDLHLTHVPALGGIEAVGAEMRRQAAPDLLLLTGDLSEPHGLAAHLMRLQKAVRCPVVFLLGNHDHWGLSWREAPLVARALAAPGSPFTYLSDGGVVWLTRTIALVGQDGWCDLREGVLNPDVTFADEKHVHELVGYVGLKSKAEQKWAAVRDHADREATRLLATLDKAAAAGARALFVATHVPPWRRAATHLSMVCNDAWAPYMVQAGLGAKLETWAAAHPKMRLHVVCGHTHTMKQVRIAENLLCTVGHSGAIDYGQPLVSDWWDLEGEAR